MIRASIIALVFASSVSAFTTAPRATFTTVRFADAAVVVEETVKPPAPKYPVRLFLKMFVFLLHTLDDSFAENLGVYTQPSRKHELTFLPLLFLSSLAVL